MNKKIKSLLCGLMASLMLLLAFSACSITGDKQGTANPGYAAIKGNDVYHISYTDYKLHKTNIKSGETEALTEDDAIYIMGYKNDIYYLTYSVAEDLQSSIFQFKKFKDGKNDVLIFEDEMSTPQVSDGYVYYMKSVPEYYSGYSNKIYRAKLIENSTPELVCDALSLSFYVDKGTLYYCDVETTALMKVKISDAVKYISENPLADGGKRTSAELGAELVFEGVITSPVVKGKTIYFIDAENGYELCKYNIKSGEVSPFTDSIMTNNFNLYGDHIYYYNLSDYSYYRMKLDGSDVTKISGVNYYGYSAISNDKILFIDFTTDGTPYISVCDLDGNVLAEVALLDAEAEELYDDSAIELPEEEAEGEDAALTEENPLTNPDVDLGDD